MERVEPEVERPPKTADAARTITPRVVVEDFMGGTDSIGCFL
jgi:hypothetical protein